MSRKKQTVAEKCAWMKARQQQIRQGAFKVKPEPTPKQFPAAMLEPKLSLTQIAKLYQWGYHKTYRFWKDDPRTLVDYKPNPAKAPKLSYSVPKSAVMEQYNKMSSYNKKIKAA